MLRMQTRSKARDLELNEEVGQEGHQGNRRDLPHQENESRNRQFPPREEQVEEERGERELPPLVANPPQLHLTHEVLQRMTEDALTRAAERAINYFVENRRREPSPLRSPCRGRGTPSAPEDNESREIGPQDMSIEEERSSQASPLVEPAQRRRRAGERLARPERREEGATSSRRDNASRTQNASQQQGSQTSPPVEPAQRRRSAGERLTRPERREEGATSSRTDNVSRTQNASQQQGATYDPLP